MLYVYITVESLSRNSASTIYMCRYEKVKLYLIYTIQRADFCLKRHVFKMVTIGKYFVNV